MYSHIPFIKILCFSLIWKVDAFQPSIYKQSSIINNSQQLYAGSPLEKLDTAVENAQSQEIESRLLTPEQDEFFESLNVQVYGSAFIERLRDLQDYTNKHGTCHVPKRYAENPTLGK